MLGQGSNPSHSNDQSHSSDNARSFTHWATRELLSGHFFNILMQQFMYFHLELTITAGRIQKDAKVWLTF